MYNIQRISDFICDFRSIPVYREPNQKITKVTKYLPTNEVKAEDIETALNGLFFVKSQTTAGLKYVVDSKICMCTCPVGKFGNTCKHQVGVYLHTSAVLFTFPPVSITERCRFHEILMGSQPEPGYYDVLYNGYKSNDNSDIVNQSQTVNATMSSSSQTQMIVQTHIGNREQLVETHQTDSADKETACNTEDIAENQFIDSKSFNNKVHESVESMLPVFQSDYQDPSVFKCLSGIIGLIEKRRRMSKSAFFSLYYEMSESKVQKRTYSNKAIHPNAVSKARRRPEIGQGNTPAKKGAPNRKRKRREHNLNENAKKNQANAKARGPMI